MYSDLKQASFDYSAQSPYIYICFTSDRDLWPQPPFCWHMFTILY